MLPRGLNSLGLGQRVEKENDGGQLSKIQRDLQMRLVGILFIGSAIQNIPDEAGIATGFLRSFQIPLTKGIRDLPAHQILEVCTSTFDELAGVR